MSGEVVLPTPGREAANWPPACPTCGGDGYVISVHYDPFGNPPERETNPCPDCRDGSRCSDNTPGQDVAS